MFNNFNNITFIWQREEKKKRGGRVCGAAQRATNLHIWMRAAQPLPLVSTLAASSSSSLAGLGCADAFLHFANNTQSPGAKRERERVRRDPQIYSIVTLLRMPITPHTTHATRHIYRLSILLYCGSCGSNSWPFCSPPHTHLLLLPPLFVTPSPEKVTTCISVQQKVCV